jgi:hypothetical protein
MALANFVTTSTTNGGSIEVDGLGIGNAGISQLNNNFTISAIVPAGSTYRYIASGANLSYVRELR